MSLTMKDITDACAALNRFKYEAGPYGVTAPPPGSKGVMRNEYVRIEPLSGIAGPGRWRIKRLPGGEPISGVISNKRQLRTALLEWRAEEEYGPRPQPRDGYTIYAHDNGVRTSLGMANAIVWSYRRSRDVGSTKRDTEGSRSSPTKLRNAEPVPTRRNQKT